MNKILKIVDNNFVKQSSLNLMQLSKEQIETAKGISQFKIFKILCLKIELKEQVICARNILYNSTIPQILNGFNIQSKL